MNSVVLVGNLTRDPEFRTVGQDNIGHCTFSIAVQRRYSSNGQREADFINVVCWRKLAELCRDYLSKGKKVCVQGSIQTGSYEKDGQKRYTTDVVADNIEFLTPKGDSSGSVASVPSHDGFTEVNTDDLPF